MGAKSRNKGARGEREVVTILKAAGFESVQRTGEWHKDDILCIIDGHQQVIEVKVRAKGFCSLYDFMRDAWAVVHKADRKPWLITLELDDFLRMKAPALTHSDMRRGG